MSALATFAVLAFPEIAGVITPRVEPRAFTGFLVGPFFVHQNVSDDETLSIDEGGGSWHVSHRASGNAIQKGIPSHARALWLARKLIELPCFSLTSKADVVAAATPTDRIVINVLRIDAVSGDCQGELGVMS